MCNVFTMCIYSWEFIYKSFYKDSFLISPFQWYPYFLSCLLALIRTFSWIPNIRGKR